MRIDVLVLRDAYASSEAGIFGLLRYSSFLVVVPFQRSVVSIYARRAMSLLRL